MAGLVSQCLLVGNLAWLQISGSGSVSPISRTLSFLEVSITLGFELVPELPTPQFQLGSDLHRSSEAPPSSPTRTWHLDTEAKPRKLLIGRKGVGDQKSKI